MSAFLATYHLTGLAIGLITFLVIGLFHPLVIKGEYYCGVACWKAFLIAGIALLIGAYFVHDTFWSALLAVTGFSSFWSILEVFHQRKRVQKGWFPKNPKRNYPF